MVRVRQLFDTMRNRLQFLPLVVIATMALASQVLLRIDESLDDSGVPDALATTVDSARTILSAIASGLIASVALLLSLVLVAVQLASSQFSPRTLRNWTGDRTLQTSVGLVLGTAVYCLLVLRETRTLGDGQGAGDLVPHVSVIVAVVMGIASLVSVLVAVDHLADNLRVGSVVSRISRDTVDLVERTAARSGPARHDPTAPPATRPTPAEQRHPRPPGARAVEAPDSGWVQQVDTDLLLDALPPGATLHLPVAPGSFVARGVPVAWLTCPPEHEPGAVAERLVGAVAIGDARTLQQDIGFGITQLVDIALRALSPGVNDPNTANDVVAHLGAILLALWADPLDGDVIEGPDERLLVRDAPDHEDYLRLAFDPIRRAGAHDPNVVATVVRTLAMVRDEARRRGLPGPTAPIAAVVGEFRDAAARADLADVDRALLQAVADSFRE